MKSIKKIIVVLMALLMLCVVSACGDDKKPSVDGDDKEKPAEVKSESSVVEKEPDLNNLLDPYDIVWGYQDDDYNDRQYWYLDGDKASKDYIMIDDGDLYIAEDGKLIDDPIGMDYDGNHLKTHNPDRPYYDLVFTDEMTYYDLTNKKWYLRMDKEKVIASLISSKFYASDKEDTYIEFHKDGTYTSVWEGETDYENEKWWFEDARTIVCNDPDYDSVMNYTLVYEKDSWKVKSLDGVRVYLPE